MCIESCVKGSRAGSLKLRKLLVRFNRDENGAEYSISVVLIFPIYILFMALIVEFGVLLHSGHALTASMQVAHRTARVWLQHRDALQEDGITIDEQIHACVARSLTPFTGTRIDERSSFDPNLARCLQESGMSRFASQRYAKKQWFIADSLRVHISQQRRTTDGYVVRVEYESPLWLSTSVPFLATGQHHGNYVRTLSAEAWVAVSNADASRQNVGIPFSPANSTHW